MAPTNADTFRDDIELDPVRLDLWSIEPFGQWTNVAEGTYGTVFDIIASPDVEVAGTPSRVLLALRALVAAVDEVCGLAPTGHKFVLYVPDSAAAVAPDGGGRLRQSTLVLLGCMRTRSEDLAPPTRRRRSV